MSRQGKVQTSAQVAAHTATRFEREVYRFGKCLMGLQSVASPGLNVAARAYLEALRQEVKNYRAQASLFRKAP